MMTPWSLTPTFHTFIVASSWQGRHCAAAHGWAGLGRIVYAASSAQLSAWLAEMGAPQPPVRALAIQAIVPDAVVDGPVPDLAEQVRELHRQFNLH